MKMSESIVKLEVLSEKISKQVEERESLMRELSRALSLQAALGKDIWGDGKISTNIRRCQGGFSSKASESQPEYTFSNKFKIKISSPVKTLYDIPLSDLYNDNKELYDWVINHPLNKDYKNYKNKNYK
tara:strand:+ start:975 stop:1358 length:384 start_codon:yes stop_codon:yes gene_type:complete